jgi:hypothetical protein
VTQTDQVLFMLRRGWVCASTFQDERIPRYSARFDDLTRSGHIIERRRCENRLHHHQHPQFEWRLQAAPDRTGQISVMFDELMGVRR